MQHWNTAVAKAFTWAIIVILSIPVSAQNSSLESIEIYEDELDTLSLFQLIDSLLILEASRSSLISVHFGYTSEVSNAGRVLDVKQYGFNPGISYFHKSGAFADVTGYWNSQLDPNYDLTVVSVGYLAILSPKLIATLGYDHSFFTEPNPQFDLPPRVLELLLPPVLNNSLSAGLDLDFKFIETSFDYSWLFNDESAHRAQWSLTGDLKKYHWWLFDKISLRPSFSVLFGNQDIVSISISRDAFLDTRFPYVINKKNQFGLMNYQFSAPLGISKRQFQLVFEYNYNIPVSLPGEKFEYDHNSFFSIDLYYTFGIGPKKSIFE